MIAQLIGSLDASSAFFGAVFVIAIVAITAIISVREPREITNKKLQMEFEKQADERRLSYELQNNKLKQNLITSHRSSDEG